MHFKSNRDSNTYKISARFFESNLKLVFSSIQLTCSYRFIRKERSGGMAKKYEVFSTGVKPKPIPV